MAFVQERYLKRHFDTRRDQALAIIQSYRIPFQEVGVFGSYARGDYTTKSDIDLCMIMETRPDRYTSGSLRQDLEDIGVELVYVKPETFRTSEEPIYQNMRRDYVRLL